MTPEEEGQEPNAQPKGERPLNGQWPEESTEFDEAEWEQDGPTAPEELNF